MLTTERRVTRRIDEHEALPALFAEVCRALVHDVRLYARRARNHSGSFQARAVTLVVVVCVLVGAFVVPSNAATTPTLPPQANTKALPPGGVDQDRLTITDSAGNVLVDQRWNTEGKTSTSVQGSGTLATSSSGGVSPLSLGQPSSAGCVSYSVHYRRGRSYYFVYFTYYVYTYTAYVCYNAGAYGGVVHNGQGSVFGPWYAGTRFTEIDPLFRIDEQTNASDHPYNWNGVGPYSGHTWYRQHHVENCIGIGPISQCLHEYPYIQLWVHSDSTYDYAAGR